MVMILELIAGIAKLSLIVVCFHLALHTYARHQQPTWSEPLQRRRFAILLILVLTVSAIKVSEDVIGGESGLVDEAILLFIHHHVSGKLTDFFEAFTFTGSSTVLFPLTTVGSIALFLMRRRVEALLLAASAISGALVVYLLKMAVGRIRPVLWDTDLYWGSSFPSGHTLVVAAFATATILCVNRAWPAARGVVFSIAVAWILLVAFSRLVLGVHWPTDVLVAACIGAILPLAISFLLEPLHA